MSNQFIYSVIVSLHKSVPQSTFDYACHKIQKLEAGQIVKVPFGKKVTWGVIEKLQEDRKDIQIKQIIKVFDGYILSGYLMRFINWVAEWNFTSKGSVLKLVLSNIDIIEKENKPIGWIMNTNPDISKLKKLFPNFKLTKKRKQIIRTLSQTKPILTKELIDQTGASKRTISELEKLNIINSMEVSSDISLPEFKVLRNSNIILNSSQRNAVEKINRIKSNNKFDAIMHFAAFIKVEESVKNPNKYFKNNKDNAINFFETCYENKLTNLIFSSTAAVYGNNKTNKPMSEKMDLNPLNPYGKSKLDVENYLLKNSDRFNYIILRYFNVAGADPELRSGLISNKSSHLIKITSEVAIGKRKKITIYGNDYKTFDGTAVRDYIHVSDLADIHINILNFLKKNKVSNIFNCGYGKGFSVKEVIDTANKITNNSIKYEFGNRRPGDAESLISDVSKLQNAINWKPHYNNLETIIESSIKWEKQLYAKNL